MVVAFDDDKQKKRLEDLYKTEAEDLARLLSQKYGLPYIDLSRFSINTDALKIVPEPRARSAGFAPFEIKGRKVEAAVSAPENPELKALLDELRMKQYIISLYLASEVSLERVFERYKELSSATNTEAGLIDISDEHLTKYLSTLDHVSDIQNEISVLMSSSSPHGTSKILELLLAGALAVDASDIHFEPQEQQIRLRYRLDGVLHDVSDFKSEAYKLILSRIKLISGLKLNVKETAQDGRFTIKIQGAEIEIRTSVIPGAYGESIVLRILNPKSISVPLESMGIEPYLLDIFSAEISKPNGLVLVTGPTGSGKTTTLYAFLKKVNQSGTKIITIEDPIEYHLTGISQTQMNEATGYTFLEGLRSALRQDPDIIMVGEIRDSETAKIAINSALTGHLVFSTLHTNDAAGAIPRLIDLGVNPKVIGSALTLTIAQRLVRKLCDKCKKADIPNEKEKTLIEAVVLSAKNSPVQFPTLEKVYRPVGCDACNGTGYKGRTGVFEAIKMTSEVEKIIPQNPSDNDIATAAEPQGILTMRQDGVLKILRGITDMSELQRVVDITI